MGVRCGQLLTLQYLERESVEMITNKILYIGRVTWFSRRFFDARTIILTLVRVKVFLRKFVES